MSTEFVLGVLAEYGGDIPDESTDWDDGWNAAHDSCAELIVMVLNGEEPYDVSGKMAGALAMVKEGVRLYREVADRYAQTRRELDALRASV